MNNLKSFIKKNSFLLVCIISIILIIVSISLSFAYFTKKTDVSKNVISIGEIKIDLVEDKWNSENAKNIEPNTTLEKNPKVTNTGKNDAYVYLSVKVPKKNVILVNNDETLADKAVTELFSYSINSNWDLLETDTSSTDYNMYVYGYTSGLLVKDASTFTLFDSITYKNVLEGQVSVNENLNVDIVAYGLQSDTINLVGSTTKDKMTYGYDTYLKEA